jgi:transcriptional regulator with XRE-family HTH domain
MLSETLRLLRVFHDLKQIELAGRLEISKSYLSEIENGNRTPSMEILQRYADTFRIPLSSILFFSENIDDARHGRNVATSAKSAISSKIMDFLRLIEARTELDA